MKANQSQAARKDARFLRELAEQVSSRPRSLDVDETTNQLNDLVKTRKNHGDKLLKASAVLLICPDPITDAAAVPLLVAGTLMKSRQSSSLNDVYSDLSKTLTSLASLSSSL